MSTAKLELAHLLEQISEEGRLQLVLSLEAKAAGDVMERAFCVARAEGLAVAGDAVLHRLKELG